MILSFLRRIIRAEVTTGTMRIERMLALYHANTLAKLKTMERMLMSNIDELKARTEELIASNNQLIAQGEAITLGVQNVTTAVAAETEKLDALIAALSGTSDAEIANLVREVKAARDATNEAVQRASEAAGQLGTAQAQIDAGTVRAADALDGVNITGLSPNPIDAGGELTITGAGFGTDENVVVTFGNEVTTLARPTSDTAIVVALPPDAGSGPVTVETVGGGRATSADSLSVNQPV